MRYIEQGPLQNHEEQLNFHETPHPLTINAVLRKWTEHVGVSAMRKPETKQRRSQGRRAINTGSGTHDPRSTKRKEQSIQSGAS